MSKTAGGSNRVDVFAMSDDHTVTGTTETNVLFSFNAIESSQHSAQASGGRDIQMTSQQYDSLYGAIQATVLPPDPTAGATAATDEELEDGTGGGASSSVIPTVLVIYYGPWDVDNDKRQVITQVMKFDRSSFDLAATKSSTTNKATPKLTFYKPTENTTVLKELYRAALVDEPASNVTLSPSVPYVDTWLDTP